jgi:Rieske Fe-S protein
MNRPRSRRVSTGMTADTHQDADTDPGHRHPRRRVLTTSVTMATAAVGTAALAACGDSPGSTGSPDSPSSSGQPSRPAPSGQALAKLADIPVGQAAAAKTPNGKDIVVARPTATTAAAFSATCTHQGCTVQPAGAELKCPCHGSVFDALTGAVKHGPAKSPLPAVPVQVVGDKVVTA